MESQETVERCSNKDDDDVTLETDRFLPLERADSQEFFLPFDEDYVIPEDQPHLPMTAAKFIAGATEGQEDKTESSSRSPPGRDIAVAKLEEFFLGGSSFSTPPQYLESQCHNGFSPVSTIDIGSALSPERHSSERGVSLGKQPKSSLLEDDRENSNATPRQLCSPIHNQTCTFTKLSTSDRTASLPLELTSIKRSPRAMIRCRPSLKKVSSYGQLAPIKPSVSSNTLKRNVSFGSMKIREFNVAISDNPCCSYGPPIGLSWEYQEMEEVPLEAYEASREGNRRKGHSLLLSFYERHFMLIKQGGYSKKEIKETMREVERVKRDRMVTDLFLPASPLDETMEHVLDTVKKYFHRPQKDIPGRRAQDV